MNWIKYAECFAIVGIARSAVLPARKWHRRFEAGRVRQSANVENSGPSGGVQFLDERVARGLPIEPEHTELQAIFVEKRVAAMACASHRGSGAATPT
jgi:hypothetical protein